MTPNRLLAHFHRIAEAPDAVSRLRQFILDLAVRGKLVEQNPDDEPASELLKRIQAEKARLTTERTIRKEKPLPPFEADRAPFDVPSGWEWTRIRQVTTDRGQTIPNEEFTYIDVTAINKETGCIGAPNVLTASEAPSRARKLVGKGDVLYSCVRPYLLNIAIVEEDMVPRPIASTAFAILNGLGLVLPRYLWISLRSPFMVGCVEEKMRGQAYPAINDSDFALLPFPLPPLAEQHRIVAKVDKLMALCDRLEAAKEERESRRDRLVAASLHRLNNGADADVFREHARFHLRNLPRLATRPEHIAQLRQTILNLAVRGKLLAQCSDDESASELLKRVGCLAKPPRYRNRSPDLIPGDCGLSIGNPNRPLPDGWSWVPLVDVARIESGHTPSRNRPDWWGGDISWMGLVDARIHDGGTIYETIQHTNGLGIANSAARVLPAGTVCFSRTASVGYVVIMGKPMATSQDFVNWVPSDAISSSWLQLVLMAEKPALGRFSKGAVHQTIYYPAWLSMHIALPPLAEQKRIVVRAKELMALCNKVEIQLVATQEASGRLIESTLREALSAS